MWVIWEYLGTASVVPTAAPGFEVAPAPAGSREATAPTASSDGLYDAPERRSSVTRSW